MAIDAATGKTKWETTYAAPFDETCSKRLGPAPRSAPLIAGDRLITVSAGGLMHRPHDPRPHAGLHRPLWTVPALVGTKLFLRDRKEIVALELGPAS